MNLICLRYQIYRAITLLNQHFKYTFVTTTGEPLKRVIRVSCLIILSIITVVIKSRPGPVWISSEFRCLALNHPAIYAIWENIWGVITWIKVQSPTRKDEKIALTGFTTSPWFITLRPPIISVNKHLENTRLVISRAII